MVSWCFMLVDFFFCWLRFDFGPPCNTACFLQSIQVVRSVWYGHMPCIPIKQMECLSQSLYFSLSWLKQMNWPKCASSRLPWWTCISPKAFQDNVLPWTQASLVRCYEQTCGPWCFSGGRLLLPWFSFVGDDAAKLNIHNWLLICSWQRTSSKLCCSKVDSKLMFQKYQRFLCSISRKKDLLLTFFWWRIAVESDRVPRGDRRKRLQYCWWNMLCNSICLTVLHLLWIIHPRNLPKANGWNLKMMVSKIEIAFSRDPFSNFRGPC